jgi:hypothetical protein
MKSNFENATYPGKVSTLSVQAHGPTSLVCFFDEPVEHCGAMIIEYLSTIYGLSLNLLKSLIMLDFCFS